MQFLLYYLFIINALGWLIMLIDKLKAKKHAWRIPEATLMGVALLGGSLGAMVSMLMFRHKTKHLKFALGLPLIFVVQLAALFYFIAHY